MKRQKISDNNIHISLIYPNINFEKNLICSINAIFGRNVRFGTSAYSYLELRETKNGELPVITDTRKEARALADILESRIWWWTFLGYVNVTKTAYRDHHSEDVCEWDIDFQYVDV